ncbi:RICIN domain-containing protein [Actinospica durhamensis]|uniref:RICIN domain-containing protein n=1 Tax=Actinospica durhamensis TaxID=1508375 RepID=A0A941EXD2_9ACTN|nr:RICIN domain-containing protein [Actinospica durhamensis]MBR7838981.1 RICIN domain-containing protein [Actinospica durhamensis]
MKIGTRSRLRAALVAAVAAGSAVFALCTPAFASAPTEQTLYSLPSTTACTKAYTNCVLYPKAAALPSGRLVAAFEESTVTSAGSAKGQTIPIYKSDDNGTTWQYLTGVQAPAYLTSNSADAQYVSNWTNPYLYVLPQAVGTLAAGTLVMASVVSADDSYYLDQVKANGSYTPTHDGDRNDTAIALYASTDSGATWSFVNIIATGGWSNGYSYPATEDTYHENDPVWEPYLMVYDNELVCYYSDENDYTGYNASTGVATLDPNNATTPDPDLQILAHRTWSGSSSTAWSSPVVDVSGTTVTNSSGYTEIGGGRPGMTNVVETSDGMWLMTFEYWGGGDNVRYKLSSNPLDFYAVGGTAGTGISSLPVTSGSSALAQGGSPVLLRLPNGRILFNAAGSGSVWTDASGSSTGSWTQQGTGMPAAYSRSLTYIPATGRVEIIGGKTTINYADVDFGGSVGAYYRLVNENSGKDLGVLGADLLDGQDVVQWTSNGSTDQEWHLTSLGNGYDALLDDNSGRALGIWQASTASGASAVQWVQNASYDQQWQLVAVGSYYELVNRNSGLALSVSGSSTADGAQVVQQAYTGATSQLWSLVEVSS